MHIKRSYLTAWKKILTTILWAHNTPTSKKIFNRGVSASLDLNLCSFHMSRVGLGYSMLYQIYVSHTVNEWQSLTVTEQICHNTDAQNHAKLSLSNENKILNSNSISKSSLTLLCYREDDYNWNSPLPSSALLCKATAGPGHPGRSLDCRQHSILWMPASGPSVRSIGTGG